MVLTSGAETVATGNWPRAMEPERRRFCAAGSVLGREGDGGDAGTGKEGGEEDAVAGGGEFGEEAGGGAEHGRGSRALRVG